LEPTALRRENNNFEYEVPLIGQPANCTLQFDEKLRENHLVKMICL